MELRRCGFGFEAAKRKHFSLRWIQRFDFLECVVAAEAGVRDVARLMDRVGNLHHAHESRHDGVSAPG
jgi:hypothetical protein